MNLGYLEAKIIKRPFIFLTLFSGFFSLASTSQILSLNFVFASSNSLELSNTKHFFILFSIQFATVLIVAFIIYQLFKNMYLELKENRQKLSSYQENLEKVVRDRTLELVGTKKELESATKAKSLMLSNFSHELRTPLNSIILLSNIMKTNRDESFNDDQVKMGTVIHQAGQELLKTINEILDLVELEGQKTKANISTFPIQKLIETEISKARQNLIDSSIKLEFNPCDCILSTDLDKLSLIISTIISHCLKQKDPGKILISCEQNAEKFEIKIIDNRYRISNEEIEIILNQNNECSNNQTHLAESGLGLYLIKPMIQVINGDISILASENHETIFKISLPYFESSNEVKNIAIIDDDEMVLYSLETALNNPAHNIDVYKNGYEFIDFIEDNSDYYHIIFLDLMMRPIDGINLLKLIKEKNIQIKSAIYIFSASAEEGPIKQSIQLGAKDIISKPVDLEKLNQILMREFGHAIK